MSCAIVRRDVINSVAIIATPATNRTAVHVSRMMKVNFRLIGIFASHFILLPALSRVRLDDPCPLEQLGSNLDPLGLRSLGVDLEADFAVLDIEIDDAALLGKPFGLSDCHHGRAL